MTPEKAMEVKRRLFNVIDSHVAVIDPKTGRPTSLLSPELEWELEEKLVLFDAQIRGVGFGPNLDKWKE